MLRSTLAATFLSGFAALSALAQANTKAVPPAATPLPQLAPAPAKPMAPIAGAPTPATGKSVVFTATSAYAVDKYEVNAGTVRRMVDALVMAVTGRKEIRAAWQSLVGPKDRVGLKISATGGRYFSTHVAVVEAVVAGLEAAGVPRSQVFVWDRSMQGLADAGYAVTRGGYQLRAIDPISGYDPQAKFIAPVLGELIWGDVMFRGKITSLRRPADDQTVSAESHFARVLTGPLTKIINLPTLSDESGCGVAGALYNVTVPNVDNWRRLVQGSGTSSIPDLFAEERIGPKVVLNLMDGLIAQYAGGPAFNPNYALTYRTLLASKDPVALDATALRLIEGWRKQANLPPIQKLAAWIEEAETIGLGNFDESAIAVRALAP